jgi:SAM-dependent methyltransferase
MDEDDLKAASVSRSGGIPDLETRLDALWELASVARAWGGEPGTVLTELAQRVARLCGFDLEATTMSEAASLVAGIRSQLQLAAELAEGRSSPGWNPPDDATLQAQGLASRRIADLIGELAAVNLDLGRQLAAPGARFLDVGVGVAQISLGMCQAFPQLQCIGLDINPRPLSLAADNIAVEKQQARVELRLQSIGDLPEKDAFTLAWVPLPFLPEDVARCALRALLSALAPGGWLLVACHDPDRDEKATAMSWLQATIIGGSHFTTDDTTAVLAEIGYSEISCPPTPPGAPRFVLARRPKD